MKQNFKIDKYNSKLKIINNLIKKNYHNNE